ncbi:Protocadherin beta-17-like [Homarus americanus]|uniref:Protocadherin beta-17-like n=1 Tax=Homarus americanus TaxID=6706 RepID=A0A8J5JZ15_HOMAM|nr:Protocadherin beta-17-like [Homarus americanus]
MKSQRLTVTGDGYGSVNSPHLLRSRRCWFDRSQRMFEIDPNWRCHYKRKLDVNFDVIISVSCGQGGVLPRSYHRVLINVDGAGDHEPVSRREYDTSVSGTRVRQHRLTATTQIAVTILDENDNYPQFTERTYTVGAGDINAATSPVIAHMANDHDSDREENHHYTFAVVSAGHGDLTQSASATVIPDSGPKRQRPIFDLNYEVSVSEEKYRDAVITVTATDRTIHNSLRHNVG